MLTDKNQIARNIFDYSNFTQVCWTQKKKNGEIHLTVFMELFFISFIIHKANLMLMN